MSDILSTLGPYAKFVRVDGGGLIGPSGAVNSVTYDLRSVDYITHYVPFCAFVRAYFADLTKTSKDCVLLASALVTVSHLKNGYANRLIVRTSRKFDKLASQADFGNNDNLEAILGAIRIAIELGCPRDMKVMTLIEIVEKIDNSAKLRDARIAVSILYNNRDVLELLYDGRLDEAAEDRLDAAVQALERVSKRPTDGIES